MRQQRTVEQLQFDAIRGDWWTYSGPMMRALVAELEPIAKRLRPDDYRHKLLAQIRAQGETLSEQIAS